MVPSSGWTALPLTSRNVAPSGSPGRCQRGAKDVVVRQQGMHAIDGDELLRQRRTARRSVRSASRGMPLMISRSLRRPKARVSRSPCSPHQSPRRAKTVVGWLMMAGVHSTVWILASSAALISASLSNSSSSDQVGYSAAEAIADRVVLAGEERVQHRQPEPPARLLASALEQRRWDHAVRAAPACRPCRCARSSGAPRCCHRSARHPTSGSRCWRRWAESRVSRPVGAGRDACARWSSAAKANRRCRAAAAATAPHGGSSRG